MAFDFEEMLAKKRPATAEVVISLDADLTDAVAKARAEHEVARTVAIDHPDLTSAQIALSDAERALEDAERAAEGATATFRFRGLSAREWDALLDEHQPTREQKDKARKDNTTVRWNEDTFEPALVAACCVEPEMSYEQAQMLWKSDEWNGAELQGLFIAALNASQSRRTPQLGKGSGRTLS